MLTTGPVLVCLVASLNFSGGFSSSSETNVIYGSHMIPDRMVSNQPPGKVNYTRPELVRRQEAGRCGADFGGQICSNDQCCSFFGYCGLGQDHCSQIASCQPAYGWCEGEPLPTTSVPTTPTPTPTPTTSSTSVVLPTTKSSATTSSSTTSITSSTTSVIGSTTSSTSALPPLPSGIIISTNGRCGNDTVCTGSGFGRCCSPYWYCGSSAEYCGVGCNPLFGSCSGVGISSSSTTTTPSIVIPPTTSSTVTLPSTTSTTATTSTVSGSSSSLPPVVTTTSNSSSANQSTQTPTPTPTPTPGGLPTTRDGTCGNGLSCNGWADGPCCSRFGYCGGDYLYCRRLLGCQIEFGTCDPT